MCLRVCLRVCLGVCMGVCLGVCWCALTSQVDSSCLAPSQPCDSCIKNIGAFPVAAPTLVPDHAPTLVRDDAPTLVPDDAAAPGPDSIGAGVLKIGSLLPKSSCHTFVPARDTAKLNVLYTI